MSCAIAHEVLLLSEFPEAHQAQIDDLRRRGAVVRIAQGPQHALDLLGRTPPLVVVDLIHGPAVNAEVVRRLNRRRGASLVIVLHGGALDRVQGAVTDLTVDGFFRDRDWASLAPAAVALPGEPLTVH